MELKSAYYKRITIGLAYGLKKQNMFQIRTIELRITKNKTRVQC